MLSGHLSSASLGKQNIPKSQSAKLCEGVTSVAVVARFAKDALVDAAPRQLISSSQILRLTQRTPESEPSEEVGPTVGLAALVLPLAVPLEKTTMLPVRPYRRILMCLGACATNVEKDVQELVKFRFQQHHVIEDDASRGPTFPSAQRQKAAKAAPQLVSFLLLLLKFSLKPVAPIFYRTHLGARMGET